MTKIRELIADVLIAFIKETTLRIVEINKASERNRMYQEAGKEIEEISWNYPADYRDATIIFEEWCKGLLTECRPEIDMLRAYAEYTADASRYRDWVTKVWLKQSR